MECKENPELNLRSRHLPMSLRAVLFLEGKVLTHTLPRPHREKFRASMTVPAPWLLFLPSSCFGEIGVNAAYLHERATLKAIYKL